MSGSASLDLERQMLSHTLAIAPMPTLARVYVALCETAPTEAAGGSELAGGGYARTAATFALMATPANAAANATAVDFAPATANWATITHFELWTQPAGGTRLYWGRLVDPADGVSIEIDVAAGDTVRFSPGSLVVQAAEVTAAIGIGPFLPTAGGEMTGPLDYTATNGTVVRSLQDSAADVANVLDYGADPTGATDSTVAIRAAVATGRTVYVPVGMYRATDVIALQRGQIMYGDGRLQSMLRVNSTSFNLGALGVVQMYQGEPSSQLIDIGIGFVQPQVTARASLVTFPPAIYAQGAARGKIVRVRIEGAHVGIDARRNTVLTIEDFECGAISKGMIWGSLTSGDGNGAKDFNHWAKVQFWPFGFPSGTDLGTLYNDATTVAAELGEIDGLLCAGFSAYNGRIIFTADSSAHTYTFANLFLDGPGGVIDVQGAPMLLDIVNLVLNKDVASEPVLKVAGGQVNIRNATFQALGSDTLIKVLGGTAYISGGRIYQASPSQRGAEVTGGQLVLSDMNFAVGGAVSVSFIKQTGGSLAVTNCHFLAGGSGVGIEYSADTAANKLTGVSWNTMTAIVPATTTPLGQYVGPFVPAGMTSYIVKGSGANPALLLGATDTATPYAQFFGKQRRYATSALVATGSTQADALVLTRDFNRIVTTAAGSGVKFLPSVVGMEYRVSNGGVNPLKVYADGADTINGTAGATGVTLAAGAKAIYWCNVATAWDGGVLA